VVNARHDVIVVGASSGALDALTDLLAALPALGEASMLVVVHLPAAPPNLLPSALARRTSLPVREARDKEPLVRSALYVAPPDYHLLVERERTLSLSRDPAVHHARPSIEVLFDSAAAAFGPRAIAVLLTGANADGGTGLAAVAAAGGIVAVQDPATARSPEMPRAGLAALAARSLAPALVAAPAAIGAWLAGLVAPGGHP
jgi:two-component system, chemotaxis family, protein-glutamate methylesterase/glutaminase